MPKLMLVLFASLLLAGCEVLESRDGGEGALQSNALAGAWNGEIIQFTTAELVDSDNGASYEVILLNCDGSPEIWLKPDDGGFSQIHDNYRVESVSGNHVLSLIVDSDSWVETQVWTLVSISHTSAAIQWNRMVSNPYLKEGEALRSFGQMGFGNLSKFSSDCGIWTDGVDSDQQNAQEYERDQAL